MKYNDPTHRLQTILTTSVAHTQKLKVKDWHTTTDINTNDTGSNTLNADQVILRSMFLIPVDEKYGCLLNRLQVVHHVNRGHRERVRHKHKQYRFTCRDNTYEW